MDQPTVSALVPIFNVKTYLKQCLDALKAQTLTDIEMILIDDGSYDGSEAVIDEFASSEPRARVIHKENSGYGDSINQGLKIAKGAWISIIEPDDWPDPRMFEKLVASAHDCESRASRIDIVKAGYKRVISEPQKAPYEEPCIHLQLVKPPHQPFSIDECPQILCLHPSIWSALYRKSFLDEFGIRMKPIPGAGWTDNPFFLETMLAARSIVWLAEPIYHYREFEDGTLSHLKDWHIIVDRWNDMEDILMRYDARHLQILQAHACRGCSYLQMLYHDFDQGDVGLREAEYAMAATLDYKIVKESPYIPAEYKRAYARFQPLVKRTRLVFS